MKFLTPKECSEWLRSKEIIEAPDQSTELTDQHWLRFETPKTPRGISAFTRNLFFEFEPFAGALLVYYDWPVYQPDEMTLMDAVRRGHGELRRLIDAPGHLFESGDEAQSIGQSYLGIFFEWSAYLYLASGKATIQFWEGELVEVWCDDRKLKNSVVHLAQRFELEITRS